MANQSNGNSEKKGLAALLEEVRGGTQVLKEKVKEEVEGLKKPKKTQLYK